MEQQKCSTPLRLLSLLLLGQGRRRLASLVLAFPWCKVRRANRYPPQRASPVTRERAVTVLLLAVICCDRLTGPLQLVGRMRRATSEPLLAWCEKEAVTSSLACKGYSMSGTSTEGRPAALFLVLAWHRVGQVTRALSPRSFTTLPTHHPYPLEIAAFSWNPVYLLLLSVVNVGCPRAYVGK